jgi:hypothetical protein
VHCAQSGQAGQAQLGQSVWKVVMTMKIMMMIMMMMMMMMRERPGDIHGKESKSKGCMTRDSSGMQTHRSTSGWSGDRLEGSLRVVHHDDAIQTTAQTFYTPR